MLGIFDDEGRGSGPMAPDPGGTGRFFARAASRAAHGDPTPPRHPLLTLAKNRSRQTHHLFLNRPSYVRFQGMQVQLTAHRLPVSRFECSRRP